MAVYSFTVKKGQYRLDVSTSDREFVVEQFELWVQKASEYAKKKKASEHRDLVNSQIKAEEEITKKNIEKQLSQKVVKNIVDEVPDNEPEIEVNKPEKIEQRGKKCEETNKDLDIFYTPPTQQAFNESISSIVNETKAIPVFDNILENSLNNPQTELTFKASPTIQKDTSFLNYIGARKIEKKIDYLLLTAYYFTQFEQKPRFTLKQLNTKLMQNIAVIIDHSVLQEAINRDYIECLPDLTGLMGASEYRLTAYGEKVILDE